MLRSQVALAQWLDGVNASNFDGLGQHLVDVSVREW
jgi:hypothetical protein